MKTNLHSKSGLLSRPEQLNSSRTSLARINFARRAANRGLTTDSLLMVLRKQSPRVFELAEVVGKWVWVQFDTQPTVIVRQHLAQLGLHWNRTRQAWQHPCGLHRDRLASFDPRQKYGSYFAADMNPA